MNYITFEASLISDFPHIQSKPEPTGQAQINELPIAAKRTPKKQLCITDK